MLHIIAVVRSCCGWMQLVQGFRVARDQLFIEARPNVTKIAILVTDGKANRNQTSTQLEANLTKAQNVEVFAVGITSNVSISHTLQQYTSTLAKFVFYYAGWRC